MKKNKILFRFLLLTVFTCGTITSCKKDYFDINQNPNFPADAGVKQLLPSAEAAIALVVGNQFQIFGGIWGQHWTQSPASSQYKTYEQYSPSADDFDRPWDILYSGALMDLKTIVQKADAEGKPNYTACALILQAYTYQELTDNFGDIPFSEALQGDVGVLSPHYDSQQSVYNGIITLINAGLAKIDATSITPGSEDLLCKGKMNLWKKFANTLLLRVYLRLAYADPAKAQAGIAALQSASAEFLGAADEVRIDYLSQGGNTNPLYASIIDLHSIQDLVASSTTIDFLEIYNDPREEAFFSHLAPPNQAFFGGLTQGDYTASPGTPVSSPGVKVGGDGSLDSSQLAPVKLMTGYESLFLQAEAVARHWLTGDAEALYNSAITANFVSYGIPAALAAQYDTLQDTIPAYDAYVDIKFPATGSDAEKIEAIITQKWIALCGNEGDEAWIEWRRTGYPYFFTPSVNSIIGPNLYPQRFYYPSNEVTRNANVPPQPLIYSKVWWDQN